RDIGLPAVAPDGQLDRRIRGLAGNGTAEIKRVIDLLAVHLDDDVTRLDAGGTGGAVFGRLADDGAAGIGQADTVGNVLADVLDGNAEVATGDATVVDQLIDDLLHG